jgi:tetraacyldisaccharide 4'-kinase
MKILRVLLFPIVPVYFFVTWMRNWLYDSGYKSSKSYDFPVICVGNLSTGGTGKSPMIEYLIRLLSSQKRVATLSRGYKRVTNGFLIADNAANVDTVGDEPFQFYRKFGAITVAVDESRQNGIEQLMQLPNKPEVILMDDAYQHRKVSAGFSILLTAYSTPYYADMVLPTGNLREPRSGAKRANIIVVTKCPSDLKDSEKNGIIKRLSPEKNQSVFFSSITYSKLAISSVKEVEISTMPKFTLVTGIANAKPLVNFLTSKNLDFEHLEFGDHHNFTLKDIEVLEQKELLLTTEKDYVRLFDVKSLRDKLYYIPIEIEIDNPQLFNNLVLDFVD